MILTVSNNFDNCRKTTRVCYDGIWKDVTLDTEFLKQLFAEEMSMHIKIFDKKGLPIRVHDLFAKSDTRGPYKCIRLVHISVVLLSQKVAEKLPKLSCIANFFCEILSLKQYTSKIEINNLQIPASREGIRFNWLTLAEIANFTSQMR
jgi:hypothetical protein